MTWQAITTEELQQAADEVQSLLDRLGPVINTGIKWELDMLAARLRTAVEMAPNYNRAAGLPENG